MARPKQEGMISQGVTLNVKDLDKKIAEIRDLSPELRGQNPSRLASIAVEKLWKDLKKKADERDATGPLHGLVSAAIQRFSYWRMVKGCSV